MNCYQILSRTYRIGLGFFSVFYLVMSTFVSGFAKDDEPSGWAFLLFGILTIATLTMFHRLDGQNEYKRYFQISACVLVLAGLAFLGYIAYSISQEADGNLLVNGFVTISMAVSGLLLYYLIKDPKYSRSPKQN